MAATTRLLEFAPPAVLAVLGLVAFDSVVRVRFTDAPWLMAGWCFAVLAVLVLAGRLAQRPSARTSRTTALWRRLDIEALVVAALLLVLFIAFHLSFQRAASDGRELFIQVRSLVMDGDFDFSNENAQFGVRGTAGMYPPGSAILWAPFHLACHVWLGVLNVAGAEYVRDGYTNPYQRAVGLGTFLYGSFALVLIYRWVRKHYSAMVSLLAWVAVVFGTFVAWYLAVESSMAHGLSLFAVTSFVACWHWSRDRRTPRRQVLLGLLGALMILVRWENALFLLLPALEAAVDLVAVTRGRSTGALPLGGPAGRPLYASVLRPLVYLGAGLVIGLLPLVPFWSALPEGGLASVSRYHQVASRGFYLPEVLFSPDHGLFSWTPVVYLAALGLPLFVRKDRLLGWGLLVACASLLVLNALVTGWDGGSGFGARRFTVCALPFALGLAALVDAARRRPLIPVGVILGALLAVNVFVMADMRAGKMNPGLGLTWDRVFEATYSRVGNPFSFPANLLFSLRYDAPPRLFDQLGILKYSNLSIDVGSPDDDRFLLEGWSDRENEGERTFRWAVTTRSRVIVPLRLGDKVLRARLAPFVFPGAPPQFVAVWINRREVGHVEVLPGMHDYDFPFSLPTGRDPIEVEFRYTWARSPREVGVSEDTRPLAVQFDHLRFTSSGRRR